ncbi:hypothetical protein NHQ30_006451 [Ciborinia camelliae]|nr:hypothetical protein NHQ30_006451 [Ciborinia camelliae]
MTDKHPLNPTTTTSSSSTTTTTTTTLFNLPALLNLCRHLRDGIDCACAVHPQTRTQGQTATQKEGQTYTQEQRKEHLQTHEQRQNLRLAVQCGSSHFIVEMGEVGEVGLVRGKKRERGDEDDEERINKRVRGVEEEEQREKEGEQRPKGNKRLREMEEDQEEEPQRNKRQRQMKYEEDEIQGKQSQKQMEEEEEEEEDEEEDEMHEMEMERKIQEQLMRDLLESEVATMKFIKENSKIPVPEIYDHCSTSSNPIGVPFILMSKAPGIPLSNYAWNNEPSPSPPPSSIRKHRNGIRKPKPVLSKSHKEKIMRQLGNIRRELANLTFKGIGSLFLVKKDCESRDSGLSVKMNDDAYPTATSYYQAVLLAYEYHITELPLTPHCFLAPIPHVDEFLPGRDGMRDWRRAVERWNDYCVVGQKIDGAGNRGDYWVLGRLLGEVMRGGRERERERECFEVGGEEVWGLLMGRRRKGKGGGDGNDYGYGRGQNNEEQSSIQTSTTKILPSSPSSPSSSHPSYPSYHPPPSLHPSQHQDSQAQKPQSHQYPLHHPDLSTNNIFIDPTNFNIVSIIDWTHASTVPWGTLLATPGLPGGRDEVVDRELEGAFRGGFLGDDQRQGEKEEQEEEEIWKKAKRHWYFDRLVTLDGTRDFYYFRNLCWDLMERTRSNSGSSYAFASRSKRGGPFPFPFSNISYLSPQTEPQPHAMSPVSVSASLPLQLEEQEQEEGGSRNATNINLNPFNTETESKINTAILNLLHDTRTSSSLTSEYNEVVEWLKEGDMEGEEVRRLERDMEGEEVRRLEREYFEGREGGGG